MQTGLSILETDPGNIQQVGLCGYKNPRKEGYPEKAEWLRHQFSKGLRIQTLWSEKDKAQGMIEFTPGEQAWRPVKAAGTSFIHCLFVGFKKEYKGRGYASMLIEACIAEARKERKSGVAVVCRDGSFMADRRIFEKAGFTVVDQATPDFQLLFFPLKEQASPPSFNHDGMKQSLQKYRDGIFILRSDQCPYTVKNVREMCERSEKEFSISPRVMTICSALEAQECPSPFGTFCVIVNGRVAAHHPISATRFINILKSSKKTDREKGE